MKPNSKVARIFVCLLCVILTVFMIAEVAHSHANLAAAGQCPFCATAHDAINTGPAWLTPFVLELLGVVRLGEPLPGSLAVLVTAFIRPPPASF